MTPKRTTTCHWSDYFEKLELLNFDSNDGFIFGQFNYAVSGLALILCLPHCRLDCLLTSLSRLFWAQLYRKSVLSRCHSIVHPNVWVSFPIQSVRWEYSIFLWMIKSRLVFVRWRDETGIRACIWPNRLQLLYPTKASDHFSWNLFHSFPNQLVAK